MVSAWRDLTFGLRLLLKTPGFTAAAVLTLALGIGANVAVFTIVNAVLFKGLPVDEPDRIVSIMGTNRARNEQRIGVSYPDFLDWKAQSKSFRDIAAMQGTVANVSEPGLATESYPQGRMTANSFTILGIKPVLGRDFRADEDQGAGANVALIGYTLWQQRYGGDPKVLGRTVRINGVAHTLIGVMPPGMKFPYGNDIWTPLTVTGPTSSLLRRDARTNMAFGRLAEGVSIEQAQTEMGVISSRLEQAYPKEDKGIGVRVRPFTSILGDNDRRLFLAMLGAVAFVLLIACANVANLLLSRSLSRTREVSIRAALGASRGRIVQQLLTESALLAVFGTLGGLLFALGALRAFTRVMADQQIPYWMTFTMDLKVFAYVAAVCVLTSLLFGLAPAIQASKVDLSYALKEAARGSTAGGGRWMSRLLVVTEVALALVLLVGAGLMIRSFQTLTGLSDGLDDEKVLTMYLPLTGGRYIDKEPRISVLERLEPELLSTPGIEKVAIASALPLSWSPQVRFELDGRASLDPNDRPAVANVEISSDYFDVLDTPLLRGRTFAINEGRQGEKVAIVNRRFVDKFWPGEDPVGKRIHLFMENGRDAAHDAWVTVVGEAADIKQISGPNANQAEMEPGIYVPYMQEQESRFLAILARSRGDANALTGPIRNAVQKVADMAVVQIRTMPEHLAQTRWFMRVFGSLFVIFAAIGALLAAVGIYAVIAYSVSSRTHEMGIRSALGASRANLVGLMVRQGITLAAIGLAVGFAAAFWVTGVMRGFLIGVTPTDPATLMTVAVVLGTVAALASYLPARRAAAVDPAIALRSE